jgi:chitin synthase
MERSFGAGFHGDGSSDGHGGGLAPGVGRTWARSEYESDAGSIFSSEDDVWGQDIGGVSLDCTAQAYVWVDHLPDIDTWN